MSMFAQQRQQDGEQSGDDVSPVNSVAVLPDQKSKLGRISQQTTKKTQAMNEVSVFLLLISTCYAL